MIVLSHSPSFNILGSYFPSWIVCVVAGAIVTAIVHTLISRTRFIEEIWPLPVVYPALIVFVSCGIWLVLFS